MRCRDEGVIPTSLKIKLLVTTREGYEIVERTSRSFLSAHIHKTYKKKCELNNRISTLQARMGIKLSMRDYQKAEKTHARTKLNQL